MLIDLPSSLPSHSILPLFSSTSCLYRISKSIDKVSFRSFVSLLAALLNFAEPSVSALIIKVHYIINNASLAVDDDCDDDEPSSSPSDVQPYRSRGDIVRAFDLFLPSLVAQHLR